MTDWNKLKVVELEAELKTRGLPQTGLKPALVARLAAADNEVGSESEATAQDDGVNAGVDIEASSDTISPPQTAGAETSIPLETPSTTTSTSNPEPVAEAVGQVTNADGSSEILPVDPGPASTIEPTKPILETAPEPGALPAVEPQEAIEDRQKRKRRSATPPVSAADAARKRFRLSDGDEVLENEVVTTESDSAWVEKHNAVDEKAIHDEPGNTAMVDVETEINDEDKMDVMMDEDQKPGLERTASEPVEGTTPSKNHIRYKDLFTSQPATGLNLENSNSRESIEPETERMISPAVHPATAALYVRDIMRPLNPVTMKSHVVDLATPPGQDADENSIVEFYLDPIRTHAFIVFVNISTASRVRSALHGRTWPEEATRKPFWVDFIPLEKVAQWITEEESVPGGARSAGKKWEVRYDVDEDHQVTAALQEIGSAPNADIRRASGQTSTNFQPNFSAPSRGIEGAPIGPRAEMSRDQRRGPQRATNTETLEKLFKYTVAKPALYWQPVSRELASRRLEAMDQSTSKKYGQTSSGNDAINRYTFDDGSELVDRGPEMFPGIRPPRGFRGPQFPPARNQRGGGYRGGEYRGGGGGGGGGYDSYRSGRGGDRRGSWRDSRDDRRY